MGKGIDVSSVFWLEQALARSPGAPAPPLAGRATADVCVVGGGYTGLWTALEILDQAPDTRVAIVEASACGFGASGRNGGWATSWYDELDALVKRFGPEQALWLADRSSEAISRLGDFLVERGLGETFRREGTIWVASGPGQEQVIEAAARACREYGRGDLIEPIATDEVAALTGFGRSLGGVVISDSASVQPAVLVRELREEALRRGVALYESSPMTRLKRGARPVVITPAGQVEAEAVVLATNAWAAEVRELRRSIIAVASQIVLTEPLGDRIDSLEWSRGALLGDARLFVHYAQVTADGRIAFGRGGGALGRGGRVLPRHFDDPKATAQVAADFRRWFPELADVQITHAWGGPVDTASQVAADFRRWFPELADVQITHAWGGPVDRAPGHLPFVGTLGDHENIHYGIGYSGNGVAPSALIGRILGRLALGVKDEHTGCALVSGPPGYLPPEPLRYLGGSLVRDTVHRVERRQEAGHPVGPIGRLAKRLTTFSTPRLWR